MKMQAREGGGLLVQSVLFAKWATKIMTELAQRDEGKISDPRVIDDDPGILTGLTFLLAGTGWKSVGYSSTEEFLKRTTE